VGSVHLGFPVEGGVIASYSHRMQRVIFYLGSFSSMSNATLLSSLADEKSLSYDINNNLLLRWLTHYEADQHVINI